ncbi:hypothetical protein J4475_01785 [Candidatus Woesearchaeota archaeon]|nr:hypothetical protein [Candidatus Woesearchaeota archaeon]
MTLQLQLSALSRIVQQTRRALELAWTAFERGDFQTAIERARDAELILALETRNKVSAAWLVQNYWWAMLLGIGGLTAAGYILYRKAMIYFTIMTQKRLAMEELSILSLLEELQKKRFKEGSISAEEYEQRLSQFDSQLNRIKQQRARLRHRRVGLVRKEEELRNLRKEEEEMQRYIQILQKDYLESGLISQRQFRQLYASDKERMVELQEEEEVLKEQLKGSRFRMFADRISRSWKSRTKGGARNGKK